MPAWSYLTLQVPAPLVIVNVAPLFVHAPALENVTGLPEPPPVAATVNIDAEDGARRSWVVTVIAWLAFDTFTDSVTWGAAL